MGEVSEGTSNLPSHAFQLALKAACGLNTNKGEAFEEARAKA